jgi:hypothetical protein
MRKTTVARRANENGVRKQRWNQYVLVFVVVYANNRYTNGYE